MPRRTPAELRASFGRLPLSFEKNQGQAPKYVDYIAKSPGYSIGLTAQGAVLLLQHLKLGGTSNEPTFEGRTTLFGMQLVGANQRTTAEGVEPRSGKINYYVGNDPDAWITNIPTVGRVRYAGVYPGIDVTYYGNQKRLEYDFVVSPGADPSAIKFRFVGAKKFAIDADSGLVIETRDGVIRQPRPYVYQDVNGTRQTINGRFVIKGRRVGFAVGPYDRTKALVIDPTLAYSTFLGGDGEDPAYGINVDPIGNVYITGVTNSMSSAPGTHPFPTKNVWGPEGAVCCGGNDTGRAFVTKIDPTGTTLVFSTYLGGFAGFRGVHQKCPSVEGCGGAPGYARGWDTGHSIAADTAGNAYVTGWAESLDFPTTADAVRRSHPGPNGCSDPTCYAHDYGDHPRDAFIAKFDGTTGALTYSSLIGGRGSDGGMAIDVVDSGVGQGIYIVGLAQSPDFFADDANTPSGGNQHYPAVNAFQSSLNVNSLYVTNPVPPNACTGTTAADHPSWLCWRDAFAMHLTLDGKTVVWSTLIGGTADEGAYGVAVNRTTGEAVVTGETESTDFPSFPQTSSPPPVGGSPQQPCLGGDGSYHAEPTIANASDTPFPCHLSPTPGVGEPDSTNKPNVDAFVAKFTPTGAPIFITYLGGSLDDNAGATLDDLAGDFGKSVALDDAGNIYVTGWTESTATPIPMCGPLPNPNAPDGGQPCPYKIPFPSTVGAYMEAMPQDPTAACGPTAPQDCVPPNHRLHAVAYALKMDPNGHWGPTTPGAYPVGPATAGTYGTYLGGYGDDAAFSIAVDSAGQAYVTGVVESTNFPGTANGTIPGFPKTHPTNHYIPYQTTCATCPPCPNCGAYLNGVPPPYDVDNPPQSSDAFVVKINAAGNDLIYSSYLGGSGDDVIHGVVHSTRAGIFGIYLSGLTGSQEVPPPTEPCPPGTNPCPSPPPSPWFAFPTTPDALQKTHTAGRTIRCDGGPVTSEADDYPCPPLPANPSEDAFIVRLDDNADEFPAAPVGSGGGGPTPADFSVAANPTNIGINLGTGTTGSFTVTTTFTGGFAGPVNLTWSVTPAGLTVTNPASQPVTVSSSPTSTPFAVSSSSPGTYTLTITGTSVAPAPPLTHSATVSIAVVAPDFLMAVNPSSVSFPQVGGSANFSIPIMAVGGLSQNVTVTPAPTVGLTFTPPSASVPPGSSGSFTVTASTPMNNVNVNITGSCNGCGLNASNLSHSATLTVTARPADFTLAAAPASVTVSKDGGPPVTTAVTITPIDNFSGNVTLTSSAPSPGLTITPASAVVSGPPYAATTYTITAGAGAAPGNYTITVTGTGGSPTLTRTTTFTVAVANNTGFKNPSAQSAANSSGDGNGFEANPTNAFTLNGLFAVDNNSGGSTSTSCTGQNKDSHRFYGYNITSAPNALPAGATVTGIEVELVAKADSAAGAPKMCVQLSWNNGNSWTTIKNTPNLTTTVGTYILGGLTDTWGRTWTTANLNSVFQVRVIDVSSDPNRDFSLDWVAVKVHYK